ncbi:MAG TPA: hypothetical protein VFQ16_17605 [Burkholderiaceae bacterium]|nr:hypothetical protein [Burkholderiaceae bacterium]
MSRSTTTVRTPASSALSAGVAALLAGCAGYGAEGLAPGTAEQVVLERMGTPTDRVQRADGSRRLEYARGPMGRHTYRIEVDRTGRVTAWSQLLSEEAFGAVTPGAHRADVLERLGRASERRTGWRGVGEVWSYRYDSRPFCRWFQVWLVDDRVREASYAPDPDCDDARRRDD